MYEDCVFLRIFKSMLQKYTWQLLQIYAGEVMIVLYEASINLMLSNNLKYVETCLAFDPFYKQKGQDKLINLHAVVKL